MLSSKSQVQDCKYASGMDLCESPHHILSLLFVTAFLCNLVLFFPLIPIMFPLYAQSICWNTPPSLLEIYLVEPPGAD